MKYVALGLAFVMLAAACGTPAPADSTTPEPTAPGPSGTPSPAGPERPPTTSPEPPPAAIPNGWTAVLAPIETVEVILRGSPPRRRPALRIVSGLPNGCVRFDKITWLRDGTTFHVQVMNRTPARQDLVCTQVYRLVEHTVELDGGLTPGTTYTTDVNGVTRTFRAQE